MKKRFFATIGVIIAGSLATIPFITSCSYTTSAEYECADINNFYTEIHSSAFKQKYISNKGKKQDFSKLSSDAPEVINKINSLIKPKDMIYLMAYDVMQMFNNNEEDELINNCSDVLFSVFKYKDGSFSFDQFWTDKKYVGSDGSEWPPELKGARRVGRTIGDSSRIKVSEVGEEYTTGTWKIVFSPVNEQYKLRIDSFSLQSKPGTSELAEEHIINDKFTWELPLQAAHNLFPGWQFPIIYDTK